MQMPIIPSLSTPINRYRDNMRLDAEKVGNRTGDEQYYLYPNPTTGKVQIRLNLLLGANLQYSIYDVTGKLVEQGALTSASFDLNHLASGLYLFQCIEKGSLSTPLKSW